MSRSFEAWIRSTSVPSRRSHARRASVVVGRSSEATSTHTDAHAGDREVARGDAAVAAVVARSGQDQDRPMPDPLGRRQQGTDGGRHGGAGLLHQGFAADTQALCLVVGAAHRLAAHRCPGPRRAPMRRKRGPGRGRDRPGRGRSRAAARAGSRRWSSVVTAPPSYCRPAGQSTGSRQRPEPSVSARPSRSKLGRAPRPRHLAHARRSAPRSSAMRPRRAPLRRAMIRPRSQRFVVSYGAAVSAARRRAGAASAAMAPVGAPRSAAAGTAASASFAAYRHSPTSGHAAQSGRDRLAERGPDVHQRGRPIGRAVDRHDGVGQSPGGLAAPSPRRDRVRCHAPPRRDPALGGRWCRPARPACRTRWRPRPARCTARRRAVPRARPGRPARARRAARRWHGRRAAG